MNEYKMYDNDLICIEPVSEPVKEEAKKKGLPPWGMSLIITLPICLLTIAVSGIIAAGSHIFGNTARPANLTPPSGITITPSGQDGQKTVTALNSVVNIESTNDFGGFFGQSISRGNSMGVIVREDGYILTSAYVADNMGTVRITMQDGTEHEAEVYNVDRANNAAILKIAAAGLTTMPIGDSSKAVVGDAVAVIGNTINMNLSNPIVNGMISGIDSGVELQDGQLVNIFQIDATAIAESVGGLVLNKEGELIAIATDMISNPSSEIGIVTPINDLKKLLGDIVTIEGSAPQNNGLTIGVSGTDAEYGVMLEMIGEGSPAEKAGLKAGDLVVKVDGEAVRSVDDITKIKNKHQKGDTMTFTVYREGEMIEIAVILE